MSHGIEKPIDKIISLAVHAGGANDWHGLSDMVDGTEGLNDAHVAPLLWQIVQGEAASLPPGFLSEIRALPAPMAKGENPSTYAKRIREWCDGFRNLAAGVVPMPAHKTLCGDLREARPDLINDPACPGGFIPLHIPKGGVMDDGSADIKRGYRPISNGEIWEMVKKAVADVPGAIVSTAGTLGAGRKIFFSVKLGEDGGRFHVTRSNGAKEEFLSFFNVASSHDGTLALNGWDSLTRIVCQNTLNWSLAGNKGFHFKTYHTENADTATINLGSVVNDILKGRETFRTQAEYFSGIGCDNSTAEALIAGYFTHRANDVTKGEKEPVRFSTRTANAIEEIVRLFAKGQGNEGKSVYDLINGATEYWTSGEGTGKGKGVKIEDRVSKSEFGSAAEHKAAFVNRLFSGDATRAELAQLGRESLKLTASAESEGAES